MTDDGSAPTIPDTQAPTHGPGSGGTPRAPDGRYAMRTLLGRGGMGEVWLAHDLHIDREIAIKLMRGGDRDADAAARFLREARVQGRLEHPSVVPVHDLGGEGGVPYFAMKRLAGTTLAQVLADGDAARWPRRTLLARFVDVCLAVEFAHQRGVIHRDLKPANVMLGDYGEAYVLDWGLARIADDADSDAIRTSDLRGDPGGAGHTEAGAMLGTPGYMAPEQMRGEPVDARTDVYALGCILFEILADAPAVPRDRAFEATLAATCHRPGTVAGDVPPELDDLCARATASDRGARAASARELADGVQRFLDGDRDLERRRELAESHAQRARDALAADTFEARAEAMREAGSAIALDAGNREAQAVLARLLLAPPKEIPPEARRKIDGERNEAMRAVLAGGIPIYCFATLAVLVTHWLESMRVWPTALLASLTSALGLLFVLALWRRWYVGRALAITGGTLHVALLAVVGIIFGPLLALPVLLFGSLPILLMLPTVRMPAITIVLHVMALVTPLALEWLAITPATYHVEGGALVLEPWAVALSPSVLLVVFGVVIAMQLAGNALVLDGLRRAQDRAQELVHVHSWQLAQLVPRSGSTP